MPESKEAFEFQPEWNYNLLGYIVSVLLMPIGIGLFLFFYYKSRLDNIRYVITNDSIHAYKKNHETSIQIRHVEKMYVTTNWSETMADLGTLVIEGEQKKIKMLGIRAPKEIQHAIEMAQKMFRKTDEIFVKDRTWHKDVKVGGLESMDNLVGLWQQGLISNEDFERERQKFTKNSDES